MKPSLWQLLSGLLRRRNGHSCSWHSGRLLSTCGHVCMVCQSFGEGISITMEGCRESRVPPLIFTGFANSFTNQPKMPMMAQLQDARAIHC